MCTCVCHKRILVLSSERSVPFSSFLAWTARPDNMYPVNNGPYQHCDGCKRPGGNEKALFFSLPPKKTEDDDAAGRDQKREPDAKKKSPHSSSGKNELQNRAVTAVEWDSFLSLTFTGYRSLARESWERSAVLQYLSEPLPPILAADHVRCRSSTLLTSSAETSELVSFVPLRLTWFTWHLPSSCCSGSDAWAAGALASGNWCWVRCRRWSPSGAGAAFTDSRRRCWTYQVGEMWAWPDLVLFFFFFFSLHKEPIHAKTGNKSQLFISEWVSLHSHYGMDKNSVEIEGGSFFSFFFFLVISCKNHKASSRLLPKNPKFSLHSVIFHYFYVQNESTIGSVDILPRYASLYGEQETQQRHGAHFFKRAQPKVKWTWDGEA